MTAHVFMFQNWFFNSREEWDVRERYLVLLPDDRISTLFAGSPLYEDRMREAYPDREEHDITLSLHRNKLESTNDTEKLRRERPEIWQRINSHIPFESRPWSS